MPCALHPMVLDNLNPCSRCGKTYCPDCLVELKGNRFCAVCKAEAVKDMQSGVSGTELPLATVGRRFAAMFIDGLIQAVVWVPLLIAFGFFTVKVQGPGPAGQAVGAGAQVILQIVIFGIMLAYEGLFLQMKSATPGKMALGLRVVTAEGSPVSPGQAWLRPFIRSLLGFCWLVDYVPAMFRKDRCTIHDLAAKTRVIKVS
ncbi:MAG TPA: RDD family protein [Planctomycetota bacterium]|nr:RDD family protein [Planctomycetota bacterium]